MTVLHQVVVITFNKTNIEQNLVNLNTHHSTKKRKLSNTRITQLPNKTKKNLSSIDTYLFSGHWNFNENMVLQYSPNSFHFDNSQSGIDNDLINNLDSESSEYKELNIFKQIFDEDLVQHIVEETNKFYHFLVNN